MGQRAGGGVPHAGSPVALLHRFLVASVSLLHPFPCCIRFLVAPVSLLHPFPCCIRFLVAPASLLHPFPCCTRFLVAPVSLLHPFPCCTRFLVAPVSLLQSCTAFLLLAAGGTPVGCSAGCRRRSHRRSTHDLPGVFRRLSSPKPRPPGPALLPSRPAPFRPGTVGVRISARMLARLRNRRRGPAAKTTREASLPHGGRRCRWRNGFRLKRSRWWEECSEGDAAADRE